MNKLQTRRTKAKLSRAKLGRLIGMSAQAVWYWETGRRFPRRDALDRVAAALKCEPRDLL